VNDFLKKTRGRSVPGPNGIPCKVYKDCEGLRKGLSRLLKAAWRIDWLVAEECFISEENSTNIKQF
jgi:hypothetical protein